MSVDISMNHSDCASCRVHCTWSGGRGRPDGSVGERGAKFNDLPTGESISGEIGQIAHKRLAKSRRATELGPKITDPVSKGRNVPTVVFFKKRHDGIAIRNGNFDGINPFG